MRADRSILQRQPHRVTTALLGMTLLLGACAGATAPPAASPAATPGVPAASVVPAVSSSPSAVPGLDPAVAARLQDVVDRSRARIPAPGLSVAVRLPDGTTHAFVAGDRQLSPPRPVEPDTVFAIASITKTFVTAAVMQLVDQGRISLDDPLSRFLPRYPRARDITVRHLLGHTSGVHDYFGNPAYARQVFADRERRWTPREVLRLIQAPYCDPGDCFRYSNGNFILLGLVVEEVTGRSLSQVIRERLLDPLGLADTHFQPDEPTPRDAARGHLWGGGEVFYDQTGRNRARPHLSASTVAWAAGAMASSASDLARWADALYGGEVVSQEALAEMLRFRRQDEYGLGTRTRDFLGHTAVGHLGGIRGYELAMWHFPEEDTTIVMLSNRGIYSTDRTMKLLVRALFEREGASTPGPDAPASPVVSPSPPMAAPAG